MGPILAAGNGDKVLLNMLEAAKKVPTTEKLASKLQNEQIQGWLSSKKTPSDVFKLFDLDKNEEAVFSSPFFKSWLSYFGDFNGANPSMKESLHYSFHRYYQDLDLAWIVVGESVMKNLRTVQLAKQLQAERLDYRLRTGTSPSDAFYHFKLNKPGADDVLRLGKHPDGTFYLLHLDKVADDLLSSPDFKLWKNFLKAFNTKNFDKQETMASVLRVYYTDDALENMLVAARKNPRTQEIALGLEKELRKM
ncbi:hypothetical protein F442_13251 [Phytophthora nicotianae P10297]|uniref:RxLR effector PexRD54 WY domain-containing protein n=1 Tax=Phytophthora nicotianae P10297 TaxID=1317064 RepID=W2YVW0_PHYNI|nr:hypothetical protein F442_13251 [Phytophthora nicotianae P10297]